MRGGEEAARSETTRSLSLKPVKEGPPWAEWPRIVLSAGPPGARGGGVRAEVASGEG